MKRLLAALFLLPVFAAAGLYVLEQATSDAATRLAFQIRNQSVIMKLTGQTSRTFRHRPWTWISGVDGDYQIEIKEGSNPGYPGQRSIGVARNLTERPWYHTTYEMNFVAIPADLAVAHHKGEATTVTLEARDGKILLTKLE